MADLTVTLSQGIPVGGGGETTDYRDLEHKPQINGVTLNGDKSLSDIGAAAESHTHSYDDLTDKPTIPEAYDDTELRRLIANKQNTISDLADIRSGAALGATAIQHHQDISGKVDKIGGMGLSHNDYTTAEKTKLSELENYDDTELSQAVAGLEEDKQDVISDLADIRSGASAGATAVQPSDLADYQTTAITDTAGYYTTDTVEGALAEIGATLDGLDTALAALL